MTERASDFIASLGVNASLGSSSVIGELNYLGISAVRTTDYESTALANYVAAGQAGIKFDLITVTVPQNPANLAAELSYINAVAPYVASVEGPNEINGTPITYNRLTGAAAAQAFQADLYAAVHTDPALAGVKVLPFSLSVGFSLSGYGDVSAYADEANVHGYASDGVPPYYFLSYVVSSVTTVVGKPVILSETGYSTFIDHVAGVPQNVQATWLVDTLLDASRLGISMTYLFELNDNAPANQANASDQQLGVFNSDGTPKISATAIHNLTTILSDPGNSAASFAANALNYTLAGMSPDYGFSATYEKSDSTYDIALWSEPQFYSSTTGIVRAVTPSSVTVSFDGSYDVSVFDVITGTTAIASYRAVSAVTVSLATDPLIIEVHRSTVAAPPAPVAPPATSAVPITPVTLGSGSSSIVVGISEDAWMGDAQFTLAVDGTQVGGVQTASALHALGQTQAFTLDGNFGGGAHLVTASFLNDAYGGTPATDRNLYIDSVSAGGSTAQFNSALLSNGSQNFTATLPAAAPPPAAPPPAAPIAATPNTPVTLGAGSDSIVVDVSEDAYLGDAQFTLAVDGTQIGGVQTAGALHGSGQTQAFTLDGDFGAGAHTVTATFLNDAYGGPGADRNLYVDSIGAGGTTSAVNAGILSNGSQDFGVSLPAAAAPPAAPTPSAAATPPAAGDGSIVVNLSEDAWQGDAQFIVGVDGALVGGVQTVTALHGLGQTEAFTLAGTFAPGPHTVTPIFINDAYGGTDATDRNLYVDSITAGGGTVPVGAALFSNGGVNLNVVLPGPTT